jgi:hypothetical protein
MPGFSRSSPGCSIGRPGGSQATAAGANSSAAAIRFIALFRPSLACSHGAAPGHAPHANR